MGPPLMLEMLTCSSKIAILPDTWSDSLEYAALLERLQTLSSHRAELRRKLKLYQQLQSMTVPFRNPQNAIQPNLISRDGPLTKEMEKTRSLGIRVAGSLVGRNKGAGNDDPTNTQQWVWQAFNFWRILLQPPRQQLLPSSGWFQAKVRYSEVYTHGFCLNISRMQLWLLCPPSCRRKFLGVSDIPRAMSGQMGIEKSLVSEDGLLNSVTQSPV